MIGIAPSSRSWLGRVGRAVVGVELVIAVAVIIYAGLHDVDAVFSGSPPGIPARIAASCRAIDSAASCSVVIDELNPGRYRVATSVAAASMTIDLSADRPERWRYLLSRVSQPNQLRLELDPLDDGTHGDAVTLNESAGRTVTDVHSAPARLWLTSQLVSDGPQPTPIVLDELGLFDSRDRLLSDPRPIFSSIPPLRYHTMLLPRAIAAMCLFTVIAAPLVSGRLLKPATPIVLAALCFSLCLIDLTAWFSPYFTRDLRTVFAGGAVHDTPGSNLNGGLWQGFNLLQGKGLTLDDGVVPWERMPGYGLFCSLAGALFGHRTLLDVAMSTVWLQVLFYSASLGVFAWAAGLVFPPAAVWAVGVLIAWLPKEVGLTQVDAVIAPVALLILAALCVRSRIVRDGRAVPVGADLAVHLAFALWFAMRPDVLPGWVIVALVLHWRHWRRLLIPVALFLAIGTAWGTYKAQHHRDFSLTTTSAGASLFCGLYEVPSRFRFAMACTDETYFDWVRQHSPYIAQSAAGNSFATREVLKFWLTYPGHFVVMVYHKMMQALDGDIWPGFPTQLQVFVFGAIRRYSLVMALLASLAVSLAVGHERRRTLLLSWPLWLDAPLFWIMFASLGRFYSAVGISLVVAAVPPLFETPFYASIAARPWRAASALGGVCLFALAAWPVHRWLLNNDAFHYWTPLLDPSASPLNLFK
ncbi:MAG: hypothetical protein DMF93_18785 [Acidobacteria bacterium]|nr:MAG: hypothetical protein DMF93_18785 [Acidobacteriota bacterium]